MPEYLLPDVGEGLTEAEIVSWRVKQGDTVAINDVVVEIETAKSIVELPSPFAGVVTAILVAEGETVAVGTPIIAIGGPPRDAAADGAPMEIDLSNPAASGGGEGESLVGRAKAERGPQRRARKGSASPATAAGAQTQLQIQGAFAPGQPFTGEVAPVDEQPVPAVSAAAPQVAPAAPALVPPAAQTPPQNLRALAKPPVRKLAKDRGIDLATVTGTGPDGVITREDVLAVGRPAPSASMPEVYADLGRPGVAPMSGARETREPIKGVRKMMGEAMVSSAFTAPHVTEWITVDVTGTTELVARLRGQRDFGDLKVSPLLVVARACTLAMRRTPVINSVWDDAAQEVVYKGYVNLGIAAATPRGLVVPNIKDADQLSLVELARALGDLAATARQGRTQPADMAGGTFTITNVGVFGVDAGTPIINPGESAILAFGATARRPWAVGTGADERLEIRDVCTLALSFDHRHVDGAAGSRFLADVASILRDPGMALLF